jgi:hypothetical protein
MIKPSRILVKKAHQIASATQTTFRSTRTLIQMADMGMGTVIGNQFTISRDQRETLRSWLSQQGIDWKKPFPDKADGNRIAMSKIATNEKLAGQKEKSPWVWVTAMGPGVTVDGQPIPAIEQSFVALRRTRNYQFGVQALVLTENNEAFIEPRDLKGNFQRDGMLAVYRGDPRTPYGQAWAKSVAGSQCIPLWAWLDFDPAGLAIAFQCGAENLLLPDLEELSKAREIGMKANTYDYLSQHDQMSYIESSVPAESPLWTYIQYLKTVKGGFTQERLTAFEVPHHWVPVL